MNYNSMTDTELLHYLDLYSDDPLIQRLIGVLPRTQGALIEDLEDAVRKENAKLREQIDMWGKMNYQP